jgi:hypothetical protein
MSEHVDRLRAAIRFLADLFGGMPDGGHILIWTIDADGRKTSHWFPSSDEAAEFAVAPESDERRVYVGVGWRERELGPHARGGDADVAGLVGLWADIDVAGEGHENAKTYPPTIDDARALLAEMPLRPSVVVRTRGGLHAWWLFKEPLEISNDDERRAAQKLAREWGATLQEAARRRGWAIDSVFDLARVLRIPGTFDNKIDHTIIERESDNVFPVPRYNATDFEPYLTPVTAHAAEPVAVGPLALKLDAEPPPDKFFALATNEEKFYETFQRRRPEFKDQSQSSYDLSLATFAVQAGWADQEIANLLIAARRRSGQKLEKCTRFDYITDRISHARRSAEGAIVDEELERLAAEHAAREKREQLERARVVEAVVESAEGGAERAQILEGLSKVFGVEILAVIQYGTEQARFSLKTTTGELSIGGVEVLMSQTKLRNRLYEAARHMLPRYKTPQWDKVCRTLQAVLEVVVDDDVSRVGELRSWIVAHVLASRRWVGEQYEGALMDAAPFFLNGAVFVHADSLSVYVRAKLLEPTTKRDLLDRLRSAGFARRQVTGRPLVEGKRRHYGRSYWAGPIEFLGGAYSDLIESSFLAGQTQTKSASAEGEGFTN